MRTRILCIASGCLLAFMTGFGQEADPLRNGFLNPPPSARPRVWWHWMNGNYITGAVKPGANAVEIKVTNLWVNRLIGDQQPGAKKYTFTVLPTHKADAPLRPSGLLGPVRMIQE